MKLLLLIVLASAATTSFPMNPFIAAALWVLMILFFIWLGERNDHVIDVHIRRGFDWPDR